MFDSLNSIQSSTGRIYSYVLRRVILTLVDFGDEIKLGDFRVSLHNVSKYASSNAPKITSPIYLIENYKIYKEHKSFGIFVQPRINC